MFWVHNSFQWKEVQNWDSETSVVNPVHLRSMYSCHTVLGFCSCLFIYFITLSLSRITLPWLKNSNPLIICRAAYLIKWLGTGESVGGEQRTYHSTMPSSRSRLRLLDLDLYTFYLIFLVGCFGDLSLLNLSRICEKVWVSLWKGEWVDVTPP